MGKNFAKTFAKASSTGSVDGGASKFIRCNTVAYEEIAKKLANGPITGLKEIVKAHDKALSGSLSEQLDYEKETQRIRLDSKDFREGVTAFAEKRKPNFKDLD